MFHQVSVSRRLKIPNLRFLSVCAPRFVVVLGVLAYAVCGSAAAPRPSFLVIFTDDVGWGDIHCYNPHGKIPTPNVDRLAREGMMFTHAHTPAALCAPTRYAMLTGNYPWRGRNPGGTWGFNVPSQLKPGQKTVAGMLKTAGYRTAMFGKAGTGGFWADAPDEKPGRRLAPMEWGFDYSFLIPRGHQAPPKAFFENGVRVKLDWDVSQVGHRLLDKAVKFLDDIHNSGQPQPFYLYFCTDGAHSPFVPAASLSGQPLKGATKMTDHTDMIHETDILTGKLIEALEQRGLLENTLMVYTSDNGGLPMERPMGHDAVAGLRGRKAFIFEGGTRVPFVVRWPGKVPAGTVRRQPIGTHDIVATALELAGVRVPADQALDSASLVPVLLGQRDDSQPIRDSLQVQSCPGRGPHDDGGTRAVEPGEANGAQSQATEREAGPGAARKDGTKNGRRGIAHALYVGDWKLVLNDDGKGVSPYNLAEDLAEKHDLIASPEQASRIRQMQKRYGEIRKSKRSVATVDGGAE